MSTQISYKLSLILLPYTKPNPTNMFVPSRDAKPTFFTVITPAASDLIAWVTK